MKGADANDIARDQGMPILRGLIDAAEKWHTPRLVEVPLGDPQDGLEFNTEVDRLAALDVPRYERERKQAAKFLQIRAPVLDSLVMAARQSSDDGKQGRVLSFPELKPWPKQINGSDLLDVLASVIRRHVVMSDHSADAAALWVVHTHMLQCLGISPRLAVVSPEKGCGKTTLLDVLARLVARPLSTANASSAAIFRVVEIYQPTLLIDEADTFLPENDELRGILNSGHRRGGSVIRVVGEELEPRSFSTYSACAIALIGQLPSTLADRSVLIELRRRRPDEVIETFRFDRTDQLDELACKISRWAADTSDAIRGADPAMPDGVFNRAADNWRPLLAIAEAAGSIWPARAQDAAPARSIIRCKGWRAVGAGASALGHTDDLRRTASRPADFQGNCRDLGRNGGAPLGRMGQGRQADHAKCAGPPVVPPEDYPGVCEDRRQYTEGLLARAV